MKKLFFILSFLMTISITSSFGIVSIKTGDGCAQIVLKSGDVVQANILQITATDIKYKRCGKADDPDISVSKKDVLTVKAADGEVIYRNGGKSSYENNSEEQKTNGLAVASMVTGIVGLLLTLSIFGFILGALGIIFGGVALKQIKKNQEKYKGKGLAITGLVCGIIACAILALIFATAA